MKVSIDISKNIEKNAEYYYERAKKAKRKIKGAKKIYEKTLKKLEQLKEKKIVQEEKKKKVEKKAERKKKWYENFRWFISSEGFLCVGGRDATTNDILIKKHMDSNDLVFHGEISGSPFFVVKTEGKEVGESTIKEAAQATASYSRAWKEGVSYLEVYYVKPEQVTKEAPTGEYIGKGAFMIRGKRNYLSSELKIAVGIKDGQIVGGPVEAIKKHAERYVLVVQGNLKSSDVAKKVQKKINGSIEDIQAFLPAGKGTVK